MSQKAVLGPVALLLGCAVGCTSLLGDFDVSKSGGRGETDGSTDGSDTLDGAGGDAADSSDDVFDAQSTVFATCGISSTVQIEQLDDVNTGFDGKLQVFQAGSNLRVIARHKNSSGAFVYTFDPKTNAVDGGFQAVSKIDMSTNGDYLDAIRLGAQGVVSLFFLEHDTPGSTSVVRARVWELPDNDPTGKNPIKLSNDFNLNGGMSGYNLSGAIGGYTTNNEYFWAIGGFPSIGSPGSHDLLVGHRLAGSTLPNPVAIRTTDDEREIRVREIARAGTTQYIFNDRGPDMAGDPGSSYFPTPQDTSTAVEPVSLTPKNGTHPFIVLAGSGLSTGDGIRLALVEIDFGAATSFGTFRVGTVPGADLATLDGAKVPVAFTASSVLDLPLSGMDARFFGDDLLWIGTPPDPDSGHGLNFLWYNSLNRVTRVKMGGPTKLLPTRTGIVGVSSVLINQTPFSAEVDVVFVEEVNGKSLLQFGKMDCVK